MIVKEKQPKPRKRTIAQILRKAYIRHCHDRATLGALRNVYGSRAKDR